jgi:hypothetical protein
VRLARSAFWKLTRLGLEQLLEPSCHDESRGTLVAMIGEQEAALWRQAEDSAGALDVYLDWLLIHDPIRGELLRKRMQNSELSSDERGQERAAWSRALGLHDTSIHCEPLPRAVAIDADRIALLESVLDQLPFLRVSVDFTNTDNIAAAFASSAMAKIRSLSFCARVREKEENYQSIPGYWCFGRVVVEALCASSNIRQLEALWLGDEPGYDAAKLVAAVPFVGLRDLRIDEAPIGDDGAIALASSPIIKTLRRLSLHDCEIGDAGALALARTAQLEELSISGHQIGTAGAAALRMMPSLPHIKLVPDV